MADTTLPTEPQNPQGSPAGTAPQHSQSQLFHAEETSAPAPQAAPAAPVSAQPTPTAAPASAPAPSAQPSASASMAASVPAFLKKAENQPPVSSEEKLWALVSYIPLVALITLVLKPESAFIRLHGRQGLLLALLFFLSVFVYILPFGDFFGGLVHLALLVLGAFSMYQAFLGNWWKIPVLGDLAEMIPVDAFTKVTREAVMGTPASDSTSSSSNSSGNTGSTPGSTSGGNANPS